MVSPRTIFNKELASEIIKKGGEIVKEVTKTGSKKKTIKAETLLEKKPIPMKNFFKNDPLY